MISLIFGDSEFNRMMWVCLVGASEEQERGRER